MKKEAEQQSKVHPEDFCQICHNPNPVWYADNVLWNKVNGSPNGIICPCCFEKKATELGISIIFKGQLLGQSTEQQGNESEKIKLLETKIKELESNYMEIQTELRTAQIKKEENEKKEAV